MWQGSGLIENSFSHFTMNSSASNDLLIGRAPARCKTTTFWERHTHVVDYPNSVAATRPFQMASHHHHWTGLVLFGKLSSNKQFSRFLIHSNLNVVNMKPFRSGSCRARTKDIRPRKWEPLIVDRSPILHFVCIFLLKVVHKVILIYHLREQPNN